MDNSIRILMRQYAAEATPENAMRLANALVRSEGQPSVSVWVVVHLIQDNPENVITLYFTEADADIAAIQLATDMALDLMEMLPDLQARGEELNTVDRLEAAMQSGNVEAAVTAMRELSPYDDIYVSEIEIT